MISTKEMRNSEGKHVRITFKDGTVWEKEYCACYHQAEDEDEEPGLEIGEHWYVNQSEIEKLEILD